VSAEERPVARKVVGLSERLNAGATARVRSSSSGVLVVPADHSSVSHNHLPRDYYLRRVLAGSDIVALLVGVLVAFPNHTPWFILTVPAWIAVFGAYGLYGGDMRRVSHSTVDDLPGIFHAFLIGSVGLWGYFQLVPSGKVVFVSILAFSGAAAASMLLLRRAARGAARRLMGPERVLFVGGGPTSAVLAHKMTSLGDRRLEPVGVLVRDGDPPDHVVPILGPFELQTLANVLHDREIDRVVVTGLDQDGSGPRHQETLDLLRRCRQLSVKVSLVPSAFDAIGPSAEVDHIGGVTVLGVNPPVLPRTARWAKRAMDVLGSATLLFLAGPLLASLAILIKVESRGPVFFHQERVGRRGRHFRLVKFRSMVADAEEQRASLMALSKDSGWLHLDDDPRITRVGRLLRMTSLDELPQLWNVLRGDMSLVGPRPLVVEEDQQLGGWHRARVDLLPGITGLWQVLGRTSIPFEEMIKLDYMYVTNWSLWGDVRLILRTVPVVASRRGAN
jgi:exopolysaccharide biosynthesis polyprenyl glycosylphosphotransferase